MTSLIVNRKVTPSSVGNAENVKHCFMALVGSDVYTWRAPRIPLSREHLDKKRISREMDSIMRRYNRNVIESTETGMYGRATLLLDELITLYGAAFRNVTLKLMSPLRSNDGKTTIEYAVIIIYAVSFIHVCVHACILHVPVVNNFKV